MLERLSKLLLPFSNFWYWTRDWVTYPRVNYRVRREHLRFFRELSEYDEGPHSGTLFATKAVILSFIRFVEHEGFDHNYQFFEGTNLEDLARLTIAYHFFKYELPELYEGDDEVLDVMGEHNVFWFESMPHPTYGHVYKQHHIDTAYSRYLWDLWIKIDKVRTELTTYYLTEIMQLRQYW